MTHPQHITDNHREAAARIGALESVLINVHGTVDDDGLLSELYAALTDTTIRNHDLPAQLWDDIAAAILGTLETDE